MATFSKAKRFIDPKNCAPPLGSYDPILLERTPTAFVLGRVEVKEKENAPPVGFYDIDKHDTQKFRRNPRQDLISPTPGHTPSGHSPNGLTAKHKRLSSSASSLERLGMKSSTPKPPLFDTSMSSNTSTSSGGGGVHSPVRYRKSPSAVSPRGGGAFGRATSFRGASTSQMQKMEREYRGEIDRLQNVIDVSNQLVEERQLELDAAALDRSAKSREADELRHEVEDLAKERNHVEQKLDQLTRENINLTAQLSSLKEDHVSALEELERQHVVHSEVLRVKLKQEALHETLQELEALEREKEEELKTLEDAWSRKSDARVEETRRKKEAEVEALMTRRAEDEEEKKELETRILAVKKAHENKIEEEKEKMERKIGEEMRTWEQRLAQLQNDFEEKIEMREAEAEQKLTAEVEKEKDAQRDKLKNEKEKYIQAMRESMTKAKETEMEELRNGLEEEHSEMIRNLSEEHAVRLKEMKAGLLKEKQIEKDEMTRCYETRLEAEAEHLKAETEQKLRQKFESIMEIQTEEFQEQIKSLSSVIGGCREREARLLSSVEVMEADKKVLKGEVQQLKQKIDRKTKEVEAVVRQQQKQYHLPRVEDSEKVLYDRLQQETDLLDLKMEKEEWRAEKFALQTEVEREREVVARLREDSRKTSEGNEALLRQDEHQRKEMEAWQYRFEQLESNIAPFRTQLDQYNLERETLLQQKAMTQKDLEKLAEEHARHMGHQNHKQKIHYLVRVKEENVGLKQHNQKLELELKKLRSLAAEPPAGKPGGVANGSLAFDPKKLFQIQK